MRSSSLKLALEHGIAQPKLYRDNLIHEWFLDDLDRDRLDSFFQAKEYSAELKDHIKNGCFYIGNKEYQITWIHRPETIYKAEFALLSFRYCKYLQCGYVLIKVLTGDCAADFNFVTYPEDVKEEK